MVENAREIARKLLQINAIKLSPQKPFTWASGMKSPIYCDNRKTLSFPEVRNLLKAAFAEKAREFEPFDAVAGVATAGLPHGALLADALDKPFLYVRSKAKGHGLQNKIEGNLVPNSRLLVVEDLISTGGSSLEAVEALRAAEGRVVAVLAIFTYGFQKAVDAFAAANCTFDTLTNYATLIEVAKEDGSISTEELSLLQAWKQNPDNWLQST